jgi:hypothetical protein
MSKHLRKVPRLRSLALRQTIWDIITFKDIKGDFSLPRDAHTCKPFLKTLGFSRAFVYDMIIGTFDVPFNRNRYIRFRSRYQTRYLRAASNESIKYQYNVTFHNRKVIEGWICKEILNIKSIYITDLFRDISYRSHLHCNEQRWFDYEKQPLLNKSRWLDTSSDWAKMPNEPL